MTNTTNTTITHDDYARFVAGLFFRNPGDLSKDFAHAVMGILEEVDEMCAAEDRTNLIEEMGDLEFFAEAAKIVMIERLANLRCRGAAAQAGLIARALAAHAAAPFGTADESLSRLLGRAKKWVGYGAEPDTEESLDLVHDVEQVLCISLEDAARALGIPPQEVSDLAREANIAKLQHRYKGGFSLQAAAQRDLQGERTALNESIQGGPLKGD